MSNNWEKDKRWSDRFIPLIKPILGSYLIGEPPAAEDRDHNTDLIVLRMEPLRIACRVRRHEHLVKYGDEFTIRCDRPSDVKTELAKIIEGWGDYFFYGFASEDENALAHWILGNFRVFRYWLMRWLVEHEGKMPSRKISNMDQSSSFYAFKIKDLPAAFLVGQYTGQVEETDF